MKQKLLSVKGMDDDRTVAVHNSVSGSIVGRGKIGRGVDVFALSVGGSDILMYFKKKLTSLIFHITRSEYDYHWGDRSC